MRLLLRILLTLYPSGTLHRTLIKYDPKNQSTVQVFGDNKAFPWNKLLWMQKKYQIGWILM